MRKKYIWQCYQNNVNAFSVLSGSLSKSFLGSFFFLHRNRNTVYSVKSSIAVSVIIAPLIKPLGM